MAITGWVLIVVGVVVVFIGIGSSGAPPGSTSLNLGLLVDRIVFALTGSAVSGAGVVLLVASALRAAIVSQGEEVRQALKSASAWNAPSAAPPEMQKAGEGLSKALEGVAPQVKSKDGDLRAT